MTVQTKEDTGVVRQSHTIIRLSTILGKNDSARQDISRMKYSKNRRKPAGEEMEPFPGFLREYKQGFFKYPTHLERYWHTLSGSESCVLTFILRQTLGFQKTSDAIALTQFAYGIGKRNRGAGVSLSQARRALESLEKKGFITVEKARGKTSVIHLRLVEEQSTAFKQEEVEEVEECSDEILSLIKQFEPIAGHRVEDYLTDKKQIGATERLVSYYGIETVSRFIGALPGVQNQDKFAPTITSPVELEKKLPKLRASIKRVGAGRSLIF